MTIGDCHFVSRLSKDAVFFFSLARHCSSDWRCFSNSCCALRIRASIVVPTVREVGVSFKWMVMAVTSAHSSMRWRAAILLRLASMAFEVYAQMYSAWAAV